MCGFFKKNGKDTEDTDTNLQIAVVDVNYILNQSKEFQDLQREYVSKEHELMTWVNSANLEVNKLPTPEEQKALIDRYNFELEQKQQQLRMDHERKLQVVDHKITMIIAEEANKLNYKFVFAKGLVVFGADDITEHITQLVRQL